MIKSRPLPRSITTHRGPKTEQTYGYLDPEDSSEWGLTHHHEDLVFYPINEVRSPDEVHNCLTNHPSIVVRIVRDAAGTAVDLVIEEFNWEDRSPRFAEICMNFL